MEIKVTVSIEEKGGGLEVWIPVDTTDGAVEVAAKHLLMNHCGWKEVLVDDGDEHETFALVKHDAN